MKACGCSQKGNETEILVLLAEPETIGVCDVFAANEPEIISISNVHIAAEPETIGAYANCQSVVALRSHFQ